jgi:hypothetical protein
LCSITKNRPTKVFLQTHNFCIVVAAAVGKQKKINADDSFIRGEEEREKEFVKNHYEERKLQSKKMSPE